MSVKNQLYEILGTNPSFKRDGKNFIMDLGSSATLTYQQLLKVAGFFGTDKINVLTELERGGSCSSCAYEAALLQIQVIEAVLHIPYFKKGIGYLPEAYDTI